jgi:protein-disulfide isomerase
MTLHRRTFTAALLGAAILPAGFAMAQVDVAALHAPSPIGEMALGPETAKVTVVEYASASCPHCAEFYKTAFQTLKKDYIDTGKIRFIFREFPHNQAALAAFMIARCAPQDKYFPMVDMMFEQQENWLKSPRDGLFTIAQMAGFTKESFEACLKDEAVAKGIISVRDRAETFGVKGIPTFFVNGELVTGEPTIENLRGKIDPLLK